MADLLMFTLPHCPYCTRALQLIEQVKADQPELAGIKIKLIDERKEKKMAASFAYYLVPAFFLGSEKLSEGPVTYAGIRQILEQAAGQLKPP